MNQKKAIIGLFIVLTAALLAGCSAIDCPMNNMVHTRFAFKGEVSTLTDTLTVWAVRQNGTDTILYNRGVNISTFSIPISYQQEEDMLVFQFKNPTTKVSTNDTIYIKKENTPHFESADCPPTFFHKLTEVSCTHHLLDDVVINETEVDYDATKQHIYIYYRPSD